MRYSWAWYSCVSSMIHFVNAILFKVKIVNRWQGIPVDRMLVKLEWDQTATYLCRPKASRDVMLKLGGVGAVADGLCCPREGYGPCGQGSKRVVVPAASRILWWVVLPTMHNMQLRRRPSRLPVSFKIMYRTRQLGNYVRSRTPEVMGWIRQCPAQAPCARFCG
jgi:hypothetical protein